MKKPFIVTMSNENSDQISLSLPIHDETRAALAYSLLYHMAENNRKIIVDGNEMNLSKDALSLTDASGMSFQPPLDTEWYGTEKDNENAKEAAF